jgi:hypothetical protein
MPIDFHAFIKESLTYMCWATKDLDRLKTQNNQFWFTNPLSVTGRRRRLVSGPGFEKMGVAS